MNRRIIAGVAVGVMLFAVAQRNQRALFITSPDSLLSASAYTGAMVPALGRGGAGDPTAPVGRTAYVASASQRGPTANASAPSGLGGPDAAEPTSGAPGAVFEPAGSPSNVVGGGGDGDATGAPFAPIRVALLVPPGAGGGRNVVTPPGPPPPGANPDAPGTGTPGPGQPGDNPPPEDGGTGPATSEPVPPGSPAPGGLAPTGSLPDPGVGAVPEPSTWGFMILGLGSIGVMLRRRRAQAARATPGSLEGDRRSPA